MALVGLVAIAAHEDPPHCSVDRHENIAPVSLIGHLWQVIDVDVQEARLVVLEGLQGLGLAFDLGLQASEVGDAVTAQAAVQARARDVGVDELPSYDQQVAQRQLQRAPHSTTSISERRRRLNMANSSASRVGDQRSNHSAREAPSGTGGLSQ